MFKRDPFTMLLAGLALVTTLLAAFMAFRQIQAARQLGVLTEMTARVNRSRSVAHALANDAVAYSRTNPAIDPILISVGIKVGATNGAPSASEP